MRKGSIRKKLIILLLILGGLVLVSSFVFKDYLSNPYKVTDRITNSAQFSNGVFLNPGKNLEYSFFETLSIAKEFIFTKNDRKPKVTIPREQVDLSRFVNDSDDQLLVSWLGHSSLLINIDGKRILADPVFEKSISIFGPTRYNGEAPVKIADLPDIDLVLISHDHYDHLNKYTIQNLRDKAGLFVAPLGVGQLLKLWGVPESKIVELDWYEESQIGEYLTIVSTPAQHFSGRGLLDRSKSLWTSFVIKSKNHNIFFGGDSGYFDGFKEIGDKYGPFNMTFLECGAYNTRWAAIHMMPEETAQAHKDLMGDILHPIHWGTFDLALHAWYEPMQRLDRAADSLDIKMATPIVGGITDYGNLEPNVKWWEEVLKENN